MAVADDQRRSTWPPVTVPVRSTFGAAKEVPLAKPYRPDAEPGRAIGCHSADEAREETAPSTFSPGAASEMYEPVFENGARAPNRFDAPTARPVPPRPFEPTGCRSAAGYSTGL